MPLNILLPIVVLGIAGIAALLHLLGYSRPKRIASELEARALWAREFPAHPAQTVLVAQDGHAALIQTPQGTGLVWTIGADATARRLQNANATRTASGIRVYLHDFTAPSVSIHLSAHEASTWLARTKGSTPQ